MSKLNERATSLYTSMIEGDTLIGKENQIDPEGKLIDIWNNRIPDNVKAALPDVKSWREDFGAAYHKAVGESVVRKSLNDKDLAYAAHRMRTDDVTYGFEYARAEDEKASKSVRRAGISLFCEVELSTSTASVLDDISHYWDE